MPPPPPCRCRVCQGLGAMWTPPTVGPGEMRQVDLQRRFFSDESLFEIILDFCGDGPFWLGDTCYPAKVVERAFIR